MEEKDSQKALTRFTFESLIRFCLRDVAVENPMPRAALHAAVCAIARHANPARVAELVDGFLIRLIEKDAVKHHQMQDAFVLSHPERLRVAEQLSKYAHNQSAARSEMRDLVRSTAIALGIDYEFPRDDLADDLLLVLDRLLYEQGRAAAEAFLKDGRYEPELGRLQRDLERAAATTQRSLEKIDLDKFLDVAMPIAGGILREPKGLLGERLRQAADTYCLLFILRETPDVQDALGRLFGQLRVVLDASIIIPCMAETLVPPSERRVSNLLRAAHEAGIDLIVHEHVINEIETHLDRLRYSYAKYTAAEVSSLGERDVSLYAALLVSTYLLASKTAAVGSFDEFIDRFMGRQEPQRDLIEYLADQFGIRYESWAQRFASLPGTTVAAITSAWRKLKRPRPWLSQEAFERLLRHDVETFVAIDVLRDEELGKEPAQGTYGQSIWWLTLDRGAFRIDRDTRPKRVALCMSPDFFLRYLSLVPKKRTQSAASAMPLSIELAQSGFVPNELRSEVAATLSKMRDLPEYLRRRKLRELVNAAVGVRGSMAADGLEGIREGIADALESDAARSPPKPPENSPTSHSQ